MENSSQNKNDKKSLILFVSAMLIFGTVGIFRRFIPVSSALLACFRGLSGALFLVIPAFIQKKKLRNNIGKKNFLILIVTGILMGLNWLLLFEAYNYTTVATATLCYYMEPTIVVLLSPLVLKEKLTVKKSLCALAAIVGMVFVSGVIEGGGMSFTDFKGVLFGLGAAVLYSAVVLTNKKVPGIDAYEKTTIQLFSASIILVPYLLIFEDFTAIKLNALAIIMMIIVGLLHTGIAYAMYFGSMDGLQAQSIAIFSYLDPIFAVILSAVLLREPMTLFGIIGAVLIIGAAMISEVTFKRKSVSV